jgi:hypothetical protein
MTHWRRSDLDALDYVNDGAVLILILKRRRDDLLQRMAMILAV